MRLISIYETDDDNDDKMVGVDLGDNENNNP